MNDEKIKTSKISRPPVVVIMGHIDHGKTTLLDYIRSSHVAAKAVSHGGEPRSIVERESGGITQHMGAYEVEHSGKRITFLDTPGHESFSRMRLRGAKVADIAVLVVAGDDSVKPQTVEAIRAAEEAKTPLLVAINKMDKPEADANRVKGDLAEHNVLVEGWGGTVPVAELSARTGKGVSELLDLILLVAEMEELAASPEAPGSGVVIESNRDRRRGVEVVLLITDGIIRKGDWLVSGTIIGVVRNMEGSNGAVIEEATFSSPVRVLGFPELPVVGDMFVAYPTKKAAEDSAQHMSLSGGSPAAKGTNGSRTEKENDIIVPLVLKTDMVGSREALEEEIEKLQVAGLHILLLRSNVGDISEDDVKAVASSSGALIIGFRVKIAASVKTLAERYGITIHLSDIIYELLEWLREEFTRRVPVKKERVDEGTLKVLKIFKREGKKSILGGVVSTGVVRLHALFDGTRGGAIVCKGTVTNLQQRKVDTKEVRAGNECGLAVDIEGKIEEGDILTLYSEKEA